MSYTYTKMIRVKKKKKNASIKLQFNVIQIYNLLKT